MKDLPVIIGILCGLLVLALLFRPFFGEKKDFWECVGYILKPNLLSWMDKDLQRDYGKSAKLGVYLLAGGLCGFLAYAFFKSIIGEN